MENLRNNYIQKIESLDLEINNQHDLINEINKDLSSQSEKYKLLHQGSTTIDENLEQINSECETLFSYKKNLEKEKEALTYDIQDLRLQSEFGVKLNSVVNVYISVQKCKDLAFKNEFPGWGIFFDCGKNNCSKAYGPLSVSKGFFLEEIYLVLSLKIALEESYDVLSKLKGVENVNFFVESQKINDFNNEFWKHNDPDLQSQIKEVWQEIKKLKEKLEKGDSRNLYINISQVNKNDEKQWSGYNIASMIAHNGVEMNKYDSINMQLEDKKNIFVKNYIEKREI